MKKNYFSNCSNIENSELIYRQQKLSTTRDLTAHFTIGKKKILILFLCLISIAFNVQAIPADSLVAGYLFDGNAVNYITGDNTAQIEGATMSQDRVREKNKAYYFNGINDQITLNNMFKNITDHFSISFWFQSLDLNKNEIFRIGDCSNFISFYMSRQRYCLVSINDYSNFVIGTDYLDVNWHNVVLTREDSVYTIYCDGKKVDTEYSSMLNISNSSSMTIGDTCHGMHRFKGSIDEILIYNKVLNSDDIQNIYFLKNLWINGVSFEAIPVLTSQDITWVNSDSIDMVRLEFSHNGGTQWQIIADSLIADNQIYSWQVPNIISDNCLIKITAIGNSSYSYSTDKFSTVGYAWKAATADASFSPRDGAGSLTFQNKMWLLGGWNPLLPDQYPRTTNNEVWSSTNGSDWEYITNAPWEERHFAGWLVHNEKMWVIGGDNNQGHYQNDVWSTSDGINWDLENPSVPWQGRVTHHVTSFNGKIWVMGGQQINVFGQPGDSVYNDVWNSTDGKDWQKVTDHAPWAPRGQIGGTVVFQDKMWIIGGGTYNGERKYFNDVWNSSDGINWTLVTPNAEWRARQYHDIIVFDNKMWVIGGYYEGDNINDIWFSEDGKTWKELKGTPWPARHASSIFNYNNSLWVAAGNLWNDAWQLVNNDPVTVQDTIQKNKFRIQKDQAVLTEKTEMNNLTVSPNPATDVITLSLKNDDMIGYTIDIIDLFGNILYHTSPDSSKNKITVNVENYSKGLYYVKLSNEQNSYTSKFIVE